MHRPFAYIACLLLALEALSPSALHAQTAPPSPDKIEAALQRGVHYFTARGLNVKRTDVAMLIDIIGRHFHYPLSPHSAKAYINANPALESAYFKCYETAFADRHTIDGYTPEQSMQYLNSNVESMDGRTAWSMYCRQFPLPDYFVALLQAKAQLGGYELTHAALQYQCARFNGCLEGNTPNEKLLEQQLLTGLQAIAQTAPPQFPDNDIRIEAMVMLYYMGHPELVNPEWLNWVLSIQLPNGGWSEFSNDTATGDHATILALWLLLEHRSRL